MSEIRRATAWGQGISIVLAGDAGVGSWSGDWNGGFGHIGIRGVSDSWVGRTLGILVWSGGTDAQNDL